MKTRETTTLKLNKKPYLITAFFNGILNISFISGIEINIDFSFLRKMYKIFW